MTKTEKRVTNIKQISIINNKPLAEDYSWKWFAKVHVLEREGYFIPDVLTTNPVDITMYKDNWIDVNFNY